MKNNEATAHPYITFCDGNCRDAMNFYKEALGGDLEIMTFSDSPQGAPPGFETKVMHSQLKSGKLVIMASDCPPEHVCHKESSISILIASYDINEAKSMFENLSKGGNVHMALEKTYWAKGFAVFTDKYGINWMINCE